MSRHIKEKKCSEKEGWCTDMFDLPKKLCILGMLAGMAVTVPVPAYAAESVSFYRTASADLITMAPMMYVSDEDENTAQKNTAAPEEYMNYDIVINASNWSEITAKYRIPNYSTVTELQIYDDNGTDISPQFNVFYNKESRILTFSRVIADIQYQEEEAPAIYTIRIKLRMRQEGIYLSQASVFIDDMSYVTNAVSSNIVSLSSISNISFITQVTDENGNDINGQFVNESQLLTFTTEVTNNSDNAMYINVDVPVPDCLVMGDTKGVYDEATKSIKWTDSELAPGESKIYVIRFNIGDTTEQSFFGICAQITEQSSGYT